MLVPSTPHCPSTYGKLISTWKARILSIIRAFAVFDATLRSYDRYYFKDPDRETKVATMIDQLGALLHVAEPIRAGVRRARRVRNFWAHELDEDPGTMELDRVRGYLQKFLDRFPRLGRDGSSAVSNQAQRNRPARQAMPALESETWDESPVTSTLVMSDHRKTFRPLFACTPFPLACAARFTWIFQ
jgi:hypothetical protein